METVRFNLSRFLGGEGEWGGGEGGGCCCGETIVTCFHALE